MFTNHYNNGLITNCNHEDDDVDDNVEATDTCSFLARTASSHIPHSSQRGEPNSNTKEQKLKCTAKTTIARQQIASQEEDGSRLPLIYWSKKRYIQKYGFPRLQPYNKK